MPKPGRVVRVRVCRVDAVWQLPCQCFQPVQTGWTVIGLDLPKATPPWRDTHAGAFRAASPSDAA